MHDGNRRAGHQWRETGQRVVVLAVTLILAAGVPHARAADPEPVVPPGPEAGPPVQTGVEQTGNPWLDVFGTAVGLEAPEGLSPDCLESSDPVPAADLLLANQYTLGSWPAAEVPADPSWTEDPYGDANWRFRFHSLRYVLDLVEAGISSGNAAYTDRALWLAADWIADNPRVDAPADMAWNDHSTALRATVLACLATRLPWPEWMEPALHLHGETLADPAFYVTIGNHALNQAIGLLEIGHVLQHQPWIDLAVARISTLVEASIDAEGVSNEQSVGYQLYNWHRYSVARQRFDDLGIAAPAAFERIDRMPEMLAYATLPTGAYELIGDTVDSGAFPIPGTLAEYTATAGASGPKPPTRVRRFSAGFLFARSGWGTSRPFADETMLTVRFGPRRLIHGHHDGLSLTLASWGSRLILDPGMYAYQGGAFRSFMVGRSAHNVVTVGDVAWSPAPTTLVGTSTGSRYLDVRLRTRGYAGVVHNRRITWSRKLDYIVVEDRMTSSTTHTYRQLWHLPSDARPVVGVRTTRTRRARGNVLIRQMTGEVTQSLVTGRTAPIQGWVSLRYASLEAAPVLTVSQRGRSVRYITLIVPAVGRPLPEVLSFARTPGGYRMRIRLGTRIERVVVDGSSVSFTSG